MLNTYILLLTITFYYEHKKSLAFSTAWLF